MIIVEGPDNSGKTTLVDFICRMFPGLTRTKSPGPVVDYDWWMRQLTQPPEVLSTSIFDRFYFSELVYGPICRNKIRLTPLQREVVESLLVTADPIIFRCELIDHEEAFNNRPQKFTWEIQHEVNQAYGGVFEPHWHTIDYSVPKADTPDSMLRYVAPYLNYMTEWYGNRMIANHGRGSMEHPDLMVVGEKLAKDNQWRTPFERSRSAQILHHALRTYGVRFHKIWFTNAYKSRGGLCNRNLRAMERELDLVQPLRVLAVGSKAAGQIGRAHV